MFIRLSKVDFGGLKVVCNRNEKNCNKVIYVKQASKGAFCSCSSKQYG